MQTIMVTGGAGFIGSHLCTKLLAQGKKVIIVDDFNNFYDPAIKRKNVQAIKHKNPEQCIVHEADITDVAEMEKIFPSVNIDAVIHLAARAGVRPSLEQPMLYAKVNIEGTLVLLEQCRKRKINQFIFGSSSSVYGTNQKIPFSENDLVVNPISPYATSKLAAEQYCRVYSQLFGMHISCLRFFTVYGPGGRPDMAVAKFTKMIAEGKEILQYGEGSTKRDYTFVSDIVDGIIAALEKNYRFEIFNLGNSHMVELRQLIALIEQALGKKAKIKKIKEQQGDVPMTYADLAKSRKMLGYRPKVKIEEGIKKYVEWVRA